MKANNETLDYYNKNARDYAERWLKTDLSEVRRKFLNYLQSEAEILDLGCGPGRDLKAFIDEGYKAEGLDGSKALAEIARHNSGATVYEERFETLKLDKVYDGIWACASLLHLEQEEIRKTISKLKKNLKPHGIFYFSIKKGEFKGFRNGRYFTDLTEEELMRLLNSLQEYKILEIWESLSKRDSGDVIFYNVLLRKK